MLEKIVNCFLIGACAVFMVAMGGYAKRQFLGTPRTVSTPGPDFRVGQVAHLDGFDAAKPTLVLGISPTCSFCRRDIPIYRQLALTKKVTEGSVQMVAILPAGSVDEARAFMKQNRIPGAVKVSRDRKDFPFNGTPTILLLDEKHVVVGVWKGSLSPEAQKDVLRRLS